MFLCLHYIVRFYKMNVSSRGRTKNTGMLRFLEEQVSLGTTLHGNLLRGFLSFLHLANEGDIQSVLKSSRNNRPTFC